MRLPTTDEELAMRALLTLAVCASLPATAMATELDRIVDQRLKGDRTGACFAVAVIDTTVSKSIRCAGEPRALDADTAFEIGSISKTMNATLLALLVDAGKLDLDDPLQKHLPDDVRAPEKEGKPILLSHLVTHTSGLPAIPTTLDGPADNPYARLTEQKLLAALATTQLESVPGSAFAYSNFGAMLLSLVISRHTEKGFEAQLRSQLFAPLGMASSFIAVQAKAKRAIGHLPNGDVTSAWDFEPSLAGVGGIKASLNDMVAYAKAQLDPPEGVLGKAIEFTHKEHSKVGQSIGLGWLRAPLNGRTLLAHEGGTGGFSSFIAIDIERKRAVAILADTSLTNLGGLGSLGLHLIDSAVPLGEPRIAQGAPAALIDELVGDYRLSNGLPMTLRRKGENLEIQAAGQPAFETGYDSAGDFYPLAFDALLAPKRDGAAMGFVWHQGGGALAAKRLSPTKALPALSPEQLVEYHGDYPLAPSFVMKIFSAGGRLNVQATGQGPVPLDPAGADTFTAAAVGAEIRFERDADGRIVALILDQGGMQQRAARQ